MKNSKKEALKQFLEEIKVETVENVCYNKETKCKKQQNLLEIIQEKVFYRLDD